VQKDVLEHIVTDADDEAIRQRVFAGAQQIGRRYPDWDLIGIPGGIGQKLDAYDSETAQVRAAKVSNTLLGTEIGKDDKPKRVYLEPKSLSHNGETELTDVLAYNDGTDLGPIADQLYVDTKRMRETILEGPMERILDPIGINAAAAMNGRVQKSVSDWV